MAKTIIGWLGCDSSGKAQNTGVQTCIIDPKLFEDIIFIPKGDVITPTEALSLTSKINSMLVHDNPNKRWYPINDLVGCEDKSSEYTVETAGYGGQFYGNDGKQFFMFAHKSGLTMHKQYRKFHQMQEKYDFISVDRKNKILVGVEKGADFGGFNLENIIVPDWKLSTGAAAMYNVGVALQDSTEWNDSITFIKMPTDLLPTSIRGLKQTAIKVTGTGTFSNSRVATFQVVTPHGNMYSTYKTEILASTGAVIKCYNTATGASLTTSTITGDDVTEQFTITLGATGFPGTAGDEITLKFGPVSDLITATIPGFSECELNIARA